MKDQQEILRLQTREGGEVMAGDDTGVEGLYLYQTGTSQLPPDHPYFREAGIKAETPGASISPSQIGDWMADGTIYAGVSPDTNKPMYATPADAPLTYTFDEAQKYAVELNEQRAHDHKDWRVPTQSELKVLYNNRAAVGGFDESGSDSAGWYWSSSQFNGTFAWAQHFSDGDLSNDFKHFNWALRCVR